MLIELDHIPACDFWNLQIDNYWMESLDYRYHRIHYNKHSVQLNARGGVTLILAHSDPALPNWLETAVSLNWADYKYKIAGWRNSG